MGGFESTNFNGVQGVCPALGPRSSPSPVAPRSEALPHPGKSWGNVGTMYLLVGGLEHFLFFHLLGRKNHPNWLSYFSEGWRKTTKQVGTMYLQMEVSMAVPHSWMVYFMESPTKTGWFGGTPFQETPKGSFYLWKWTTIFVLELHRRMDLQWFKGWQWVFDIFYGLLLDCQWLICDYDWTLLDFLQRWIVFPVGSLLLTKCLSLRIYVILRWSLSTSKYLIDRYIHIHSRWDVMLVHNIGGDVFSSHLTSNYSCWFHWLYITIKNGGDATGGTVSNVGLFANG